MIDASRGFDIDQRMDPEAKRAFAQLCLACRAAYDAGQCDQFRADAQCVNGDVLARLGARHRVDGLLAHALRRAELPVSAELAAAARDATLHGLRAAATCGILSSTFAAAGIDLLFLKGLAVGKLAFGDPFLKRSWDIDILVDPEQVDAAVKLLFSLGFSPLLPLAADSATLLRWHAHRRESVWQGEGEQYVELHSRLFENPRLLPALGMRSPRQRVDLSTSIALATFADAELYAYLCVHGATSLWFRLKWLADLAGLVHGKSPAELADLHARACDLGAARPSAVALSLLGTFFDVETPALPSDRWVERLTQMSIEALAAEEPTARRGGTLPIHIAQFGLVPGLSFKLAELAAQVTAFRSNAAARN